MEMGHKARYVPALRTRFDKTGDRFLKYMIN